MGQADAIDDDYGYAPYRAGVDITTGYSADSYFGESSVRDPWHRECFVSLVDIIVNHSEVYYPLPTVQAAREADHLEDLPKILGYMRKAGIIVPTRHQVAASLEPTQDALQTEYASFSDWASKQGNRQKLKQWIALQTSRTVEPQGKKRLGSTGVQQFTVDFWQRNAAETERLANSLHMKPEHLRLAFDVVFRGLQYYAILSAEDVPYFSHPIRHSLMSTQEAKYHEYPGGWSWGRLLLALLEEQRIRHDPETIIELVANIRNKVGLLDASSYTLAVKNESQQRELIMTIAAECGIPSRIRVGVIRRIQAALGIASVGTAYFASPIVVIILGFGTVALSYWSGEVPGVVGRRVKFARGLLEWPGLFN